jgi:hypothetical protein
MEPLKIKFHELITIGAILISVTTAYVLLNADVKEIKSDIIDLKVSIDKVQEEQFRVNFYLGQKEGWTSKDDEPLRRELAKKPWRSKLK